MAAAPPPDLNIPSSSSSVNVHIIDTTSQIDGIPLEPFVTPANTDIKQIGDFDTFSAPAFSFLITHADHPTRSLLFDLGVRKDAKNLPPSIVKRLDEGGWNVTVQEDVRSQLERNGFNIEGIEAIIWSHYHWDHTGDPSRFPSSTALVVGPGFKSAFTPGYPENENCPILESDYKGRELREIKFDGLKIGRFDAFDYYGDGSFYLLDSPGHAVGHMCGLARVGEKFVFMGGDAVHHGGEFRPSQYLPLPDKIEPSPFKSWSVCPGSLFDDLLPKKGNGKEVDRTRPFYDIARLPDGKGVAHDVDKTVETVGKLQEADAQPEVLVVFAHDATLLDVVDLFPKAVDAEKLGGWQEKGRWIFLKDFESGVKA